MLIAIVSRTPVWVWGLLAALLMLGLWQRQTRRVTARSLLILPLALLALGLSSSGPGFVAQPVSALAWAAAFGVGLLAGTRLQPPRGTTWLAAEQRLLLPGSWWPMLIIVTIFSVRYTVSVVQAMHPDWRTDVAVLGSVATLYGLLGGGFMGRSLALRRMAGRALNLSAAHA